MDWLNALFLTILIVGNTTLWVIYANQTHAMPIPCSRLHQLRRVHDVMLFLGPVLLILGLGFFGPQLLVGGRWDHLNLVHWSVVLICTAGFVVLSSMILWRTFRRDPKIVETISSRRHNVTDALGYQPVNPGKYFKLATSSLNEQFAVEFNEKRILCSGLPQDLDGLRILHISDWHFFETISKDFFVHVCEIAAEYPVDLVCFSGDLIDDMRCVDWIPETLGILNAKYGCYFILGNHDWFQEPEVIRNQMISHGWQNVASQVITTHIQGVPIHIGGDETPWMGTAPTFPDAEGFRLLLSHTPDNFRRAAAAGVDLILAGHNHGGQVRLPIIGPVYSPSRYGTLYASGSFWRPPTFMHVSRGLSGRHPFRFRCAPEVTQIILAAGDSSD